ncbi:hypothetical protein AB0D27_43905 [Streptomyces sp. NPDC048415]|jgi:hypothetical protein|uniref:hypothetical protein n=1 Tax=Streptomyces sp. NPDC048415 TaxID=3154822 RepID=UPI00343D742C
MAAPRRGLSLSSADASMGVLHEQHPRLRALMDTWVHLYGAAHSHGLPSIAEVTRAMDAVGLLDFERLSKRPRWLSERGYWPDGRPSRTAPPTWAAGQGEPQAVVEGARPMWTLVWPDSWNAMPRSCLKWRGSVRTRPSLC